MEQSLQTLIEEHFGSNRNEVKSCEVSLLLPSGDINVVVGRARMDQEVFIGQIRVEAELPDDVRSDELARLANPNFNWSGLSNEYRSAFCYGENIIIGKVSLTTQCGLVYDLYGPVTYDNVLKIKVALLPFMLHDQDINRESLPKSLDAKYCIPDKGHVYLILPSGCWIIVGYKLVMYPEVLTVYIDKQYTEEEWKRLSTKPEARVAGPSEFAFAFEARRKRPVAVKFCMPSHKAYRLHGFLGYWSANHPLCLYLGIPPFVIFGEQDGVGSINPSLPLEIREEEEHLVMKEGDDDSNRAVMKVRNRLGSAKFTKRSRSVKFTSRQYALRSRLINVSAYRYNLRRSRR